MNFFAVFSLWRADGGSDRVQSWRRGAWGPLAPIPIKKSVPTPTGADPEFLGVGGSFSWGMKIWGMTRACREHSIEMVHQKFLHSGIFKSNFWPFFSRDFHPFTLKPLPTPNGSTPNLPNLHTSTMIKEETSHQISSV